MMSPEEEFAWIQAMVKLEEEAGPFLPHGAAGGAVARARREQAAAANGAPSTPPAEERSRGRVRKSFRAIAKPGRRAA